MNDNKARNVKVSTVDHVDASAESFIGLSGGIISPISQLLDRPRFPSMCLEFVTLTFRKFITKIDSAIVLAQNEQINEHNS